MRLIVGLGNPGSQYEKTRHNVGYRVIDALRKPLQAQSANLRGSVEAYEHRNGDRVLLVKPTTFMNESGEAVAPVVQFYKIPLANILIVYDDVDLPLGTLRQRDGGSAGGHKGMQSVIDHVGTDAIPRLRIGIGSNRDRNLPAEDYVLQPFTEEEEKAIQGTIEKAVAVIAGNAIDEKHEVSNSPR